MEGRGLFLLWPGRPGESDARRPIVPVVNVGLGFEAQAQAQREVGLHAPVVADKCADIHLIYVHQRTAGVDGELRRTAAQGLNLLRGIRLAVN